MSNTFKKFSKNDIDLALWSVVAQAKGSKASELLDDELEGGGAEGVVEEDQGEEDGEEEHPETEDACIADCRSEILHCKDVFEAGYSISDFLCLSMVVNVKQFIIMLQA